MNAQSNAGSNAASMPGAMPERCPEQSTQRNATQLTQRATHPSGKSYVPDAPMPVDNRVSRDGGRKFYRLDDEQMHDLHSRGWSARQIADEVGCTMRSVSRWRKRNGLSKPSSPHACKRVSAERLAQAEAMLNGGASHADIANTLRMSTHTLRRHFPGSAWTAEQAGEAAAMSRKLRAL